MFSGRILLIISSLQGGGAERVVSLLTAAWADEGSDVMLLTFGPPQANEYPLDSRVKRRWVPPLRKEGTLRRLRNILREIRSSTKDFCPDCVISFIDVANVLTLLATVGLKVPIIISERTNPEKQQLHVHWRILRNLLYRRCHSVVVQTKAISRWAKTFLSERQVKIIPNPLRVLPRTLQSFPPVSGRFTILAVGRLSEEKGFDLLLSAFAPVARSHPECHLEIFGEGPERARLERMIIDLRLHEQVLLHGFVPDIEVHWARGSIFVLPSRYEGFPNALCEAMASGLPVVAFDCDFGPGEIITHRTDGLLVPAEDVYALGNAMEELISNATLRDFLAANATQIRSRLSLDAIIDQWNELLSSARRPIANYSPCAA